MFSGEELTNQRRMWFHPSLHCTLLMDVLSRLAVTCAPAGRAALFAWLVTEGHVSFGGGDKDVLLVFPVMAWALIYLVASSVLWARHARIKRMASVGAMVATSVLGVAWAGLFAIAYVKFGRF